MDVRFPILTTDDAELESSVLVLEPDGGDLRIQTNSSETVQQVKTRRTNKVWSLAEIIDKVIPDFYRAVDLTKNQTFELIAEGSFGNWQEVYEFLCSFGSMAVHTREELTTNDACNKPLRFAGHLYSRGPKGPLTARDIVEAIADKLRQSVARKSNQDEIICKLLKILNEIRFIWDINEEDIRTNLRNWLNTVIDKVDDIDNKIGAMLSDLAETARRGGGKLRRDEFLQKHNLDRVPLNKWSTVIRRSRSVLERSTNRVRYRSDRDVRKESDNVGNWPQSNEFLIFAGPSGVGKSWALAQLAKRLSGSYPVAFIDSSGSGAADIRNVAEVFWHDITGHDDLIPLTRIADRIEEVTGRLTETWLCVFVDNVQSIAELREVRNALMQVNGVAVALTLPPDAAAIAEREWPGEAKAITVGHFSEREAQLASVDGDLLKWHDIDGGLKEPLHWPILAGLYRSLLGDEVEPKSEYELFKVYVQTKLWDRVQPLDAMASEKIDQLMLESWRTRVYAWSGNYLESQGIRGPLLNSLVTSGWLLKGSDGKWRIWHDRVRQWLVAEAVCRLLLTEPSVRDDDVARIAEDYWEVIGYDSGPFGFVAMDLLYLLRDREANSQLIDRVVAALEGDFEHDEPLFEKALPTLGPNIIPTLVRAFERHAGDEGHFKRHAIENALSSMPPEAVWPSISVWVNGSDSDLRSAAARILAKNPTNKALDELWQRVLVLRDNADEGYDEPEGKRDNSYENFRVIRAIGKCVRDASEWLENKLRDALTEDEELRELLSLLPKCARGREIWERVKEEVFAKLRSEEDSLSFAGNVYTWRDPKWTDWLKANLDSKRLSAACFKALCRISPIDAISLIRGMAAEHLYVRALCATHAAEIKERISELIIESPSSRWELFTSIGNPKNNISSEALHVLIEDAHSDLQGSEQRFDRAKWQAIARTTSPELIDVFTHFRGKPLEADVVRYIKSCDPPNLGYVPGDGFLETVLLRIGGTGYTEVINHWLAGPETYSKVHAIPSSVFNPDSTTVDLLEQIALRDDWQTGFVRQNVHAAVNALATIEAWRSVVVAYVRWHKNMPRDVVGARFGEGSLSNEDMAPALRALEENPRNPGAIMALGFGKVESHRELILGALSSAGEDEDLRNAASWSLAMLPTLLPTEVQALSHDLLESGKGQWLTLSNLMLANTDDSARTLLSYVKPKLAQSDGRTTFDTQLLRVIAFLLLNPSTREETAALVKARISQRGKRDFLAEEIVQTLSPYIDLHKGYRDALDTERAEQILIERAFARDEALRFVGARAAAIRGLGKLRSDDAYSVARRTLCSGDMQNKERQPWILLEIDKERAVPDLFVIAEEIEDEPTIAYIALAMAQRCEWKEIQNYLSSNVSRQRALACRVCGLMAPSHEITTVLMEMALDDDVKVYEAAVGALNLQMMSATVGDLDYRLEAETAPGWQHWVFLKAVIDAANPGLPNAPRQPALDGIRSTLRPMTLDWFDEQIDRKRKEALKTAEDIEKRKDWEF